MCGFSFFSTFVLGDVVFLPSKGLQNHLCDQRIGSFEAVEKMI
jgi:hypothetical protein